jgi:hypothetical protein
MHSFVRASIALLVAIGVAFAARTARAQDASSTPCGKFDFSNGLSCKIEVSGGCTAKCTPLNFEVGCTGGCTGTAMTTCVNDCGTTCVAMCNPQFLDCFAGCHAECDQPTADQCRQKYPTEDCSNTAKAQCDIHCKDSCQVPSNNCQEHCNKCCTGSCTTNVNFDCDFSCFADLKGGCDVQCTRPEGAIFCNGQYVHASDIESCIAYLATRGIQVDVSARASATCTLAGCNGVSSSSVSGCSVSGAINQAAGMAPFGFAFLFTGAAAARWRRRRGSFKG